MTIEQQLTQEEMTNVNDQVNKRLAKRQAKYNLQVKILDDGLLISGQNKSVWEQKFKLHIPVDALSPQLCIEFDTQLLNLNQEATFLYNAAQVRSQYLAHDSRDAYHRKIKLLADQYKEEGKRLPSAATMESLVNLENMDEEYNAVAAEMEVKYWRGILDHLHSCRKIIENVSLNISVEMKAEASLNRSQNTFGRGYNQ